MKIFTTAYILWATIFSVLYAIIFSTGCTPQDNSTDNCEQLKADLLERDIFIEQLTKSMGSINDLVDSISLSQALMIESGNTTEEAFVAMEVFVKNANLRISELEEQLQKSNLNAEQTNALRRTVDVFRRTMAEKEQEIERLKANLEATSIELAKTQETVSIIKKELQSNVSAVDALKQDTAILSKQKSELATKVYEAEQDKQKALSAAEARERFKLAKRDFEELDHIRSKAGQRERKRELAQKAYQGFQDAQKGGIIEANKYIEMLLRDKKYNKYMNIKAPIEN